MSEYIREEMIKFKYHPVFILTRLLMLAVLIAVSYAGWGAMLFASAWSVGFVYSTETESMLPLTDAEVIKRKHFRINMIWLRYLIFGLIAYAVNYVMILKDVSVWDIGFAPMTEKPFIVISFFILQMVFIYNALLSVMVPDHTNKFSAALKNAFKNDLISVLSGIVFFTYAVDLTLSKKRTLIIEGNEFIHCAILLAAAVLMGIGIYKKIKDWKVTDFVAEGRRL